MLEKQTTSCLLYPVPSLYEALFNMVENMRVTTASLAPKNAPHACLALISILFDRIPSRFCSRVRPTIFSPPHCPPSPPDKNFPLSEFADLRDPLEGNLPFKLHECVALLLLLGVGMHAGMSGAGVGHVGS